jgi:hypothetical protein
MRAVLSQDNNEWFPIAISEADIQDLTQQHFGTILTQIELSNLSKLFTCNLSQVDDGGWEGTVAHMVQTIVGAIGVVISDHRKVRQLHETDKQH